VAANRDARLQISVSWVLEIVISAAEAELRKREMRLADNPIEGGNGPIMGREKLIVIRASVIVGA